MSGKRKGDASARPVQRLEEEIAILRELIQRVHEQTGAECDLSEMLKVLEGQGRSAVRLAALLKAQRALDESSGSAELFSERIEATIRELTRNC